MPTSTFKSYSTDQRVLFLGNNDQNTDTAVSDLAKQQDTKNHGLVTTQWFEPESPGFYHTTVVDIPWGGLLELAKKFDIIVMLDQEQGSWSHWKCMQATVKLMLKLEELGMQTVFRDNANTKKILYWIDLVYKKNPSMCVYAWINLHNDGNELKLCSRVKSTVTTVDPVS